MNLLCSEQVLLTDDFDASSTTSSSSTSVQRAPMDYLPALRNDGQPQSQQTHPPAHPQQQQQQPVASTSAAAAAGTASGFQHLMMPMHAQPQRLQTAQPDPTFLDDRCLENLLRAEEKRETVAGEQPSYFEHQDDITPAMRKIVAEWMMEVSVAGLAATTNNWNVNSFNDWHFVCGVVELSPASQKNELIEKKKTGYSRYFLTCPTRHRRRRRRRCCAMSSLY